MIYTIGYQRKSLATFIGRQGARLFYVHRGTEGAKILAGLEAYYADQIHITAWMIGLTEALRAYYVGDGSSTEKIAGREAVYQAARDRFELEVLPLLSEPDRYTGWTNVPTNNAFVLLHQRYNLNLDLFAAVYANVGKDFARLLDVLRAAAVAEDPFGFLEQAAGSP